MSENTSISKTVDDVVEYAIINGVILSKKNIEFMREGVDSQKVSIDYLIHHVDQIAKRKEEIGLHWEDKDKPSDTGVISTFSDKSGKVHSYIVEREIKNSEDPTKIGEKFYAALRIDPGKDEHVPMSTGGSADGLKNAVSAYFTQIIISDINREKNVNKEKSFSNDKGMDI